MNPLPAEFDAALYKHHPANGDLLSHSLEAAAEHYAAYGRREGRISSAIEGQHHLRELVPRDARILEIGPSYRPMFARGDYPNVRYADYFTTAEMRERVAADPHGTPETVPEIDYVLKGSSLVQAVGGERFDVVFSSHNIEHHPCLITHLRDVSGVLRADGRFLLVVPDARYCFDHFLRPSTIVEVVGAYIDKPRRHSAAKTLEHWMMTAHNDAGRHWAGDSGENPAEVEVNDWMADRLRTLAQQIADHPDQYFDVHAWQFTPDSFRRVLNGLQRAGYTDLQVARVWGTYRGQLEFYAVLEQQPATEITPAPG